MIFQKIKMRAEVNPPGQARRELLFALVHPDDILALIFSALGNRIRLGKKV
jgi:hypothetical protein